ncbi:hypothetical protein TRVA0_094S00144 [Trichomonascus vanleenenianus]|uniref:uncharacterized protein n=1 Tax=Trichomonascus vanleenenianus TaxID=2268995 RepID=UPI003ECA8EF0
MVSKLTLSAVALSAATAFADCQLSSGGQKVQTNFNTLVSSNADLKKAIDSWSQSDGLAGALPITQKADAVLSATKATSSALSSLSGANECDIQTIVSQISSSSTSIEGSLSAITQKAADFKAVHADSIVDAQLSDLNSAANDLIGTVYKVLPCSVVGQTFDSLDGIVSGFAAAEKAFGQATQNGPSHPSTCAATSGAAKTSAPASSAAGTSAAGATTSAAASGAAAATTSAAASGAASGSAPATTAAASGAASSSAAATTGVATESAPATNGTASGTGVAPVSENAANKVALGGLAGLVGAAALLL